MRITEQAHHFLTPALSHGGLLVDATAGNGHDTCFFATKAPLAVPILAVDLQPQAIRETFLRLKDCTTDAQRERVRLELLDHRDFPTLLPPIAVGRISAGVFNLGYLPGGDHTIVTEPESTIAALETVRSLLTPGGRLAVVVYQDHPGGATEASAVEEWFAATPAAQLLRIPELRPAKGPWFLGLINPE